MQPLTTRKLMTLVMQAALLLALFVVVIPAFRTSDCRGAGKAQCVNNLKQMGLGLLDYTQSHGHFPPGTIPNPDVTEARRLGWGSTILPYVDEFGYPSKRVFDEESTATKPWDDPTFADLASNPPCFSYCPDSHRRAGYVAIAGLGVDAPGYPKSHRDAGIFGDDRTVTPADLKDGASTTMMLAESDASGTPWFAGGWATVRGLDPARKPYLGLGRQFGGHHKGGANVLFADGSVKFLSDSIEPKVFEALSTMAGGEAASADEP